MMSKNFRSILLAALSLLAISCGEKESVKVLETADSFMDAFYKSDFESARRYSSAAMIDRLAQAESLIMSQEAQIRDEIIAIGKETEFVRCEWNKDNDGLYRVTYDVMIPDEPTPSRVSILVTLCEEGIWKVEEII